MTRTMSPGPRTGAVQIPASKSQAHRMLICAALSKAPSRLVLDGFSADIEATVQCLEALGAQLTQETAGLLIAPIGARPANAKLDVGESGSTLRFLLPVLGALGIRAEIQMHGRLPERPLSPLWEVLEAHGMQLQRDGAVLHTDGQLCAGDYSLPGNVSSQFISGLLFALPLLSGNSTLTVTGALQSARYVAMTEQTLAAAGILQKGWPSLADRQRAALCRACRADSRGRLVERGVFPVHGRAVCNRRDRGGVESRVFAGGPGHYGAFDALRRGADCLRTDCYRAARRAARDHAGRRADP